MRSMGGSKFFVAGLLTMAMVGSVLASAAAAQVDWACDGVPATIVGTPGDDTLTGTAGPDVIFARQGDDIIRGLGGDDIICGGQGNDTIFGGAGFDILFGAQGNDTIFAANGASVTTRQDTRGARMFGGAGSDTIHGTNRWDRMQGGPGGDTLFGYEGRDWMRAGADNDQVDGGPGIDDLHGGNGRDTIQLTNGDLVKGGAGLDQCNISLGSAGNLKSCGINEREEPRQIGTQFVHTDWQGETWRGELYGLVPVNIGEFDDVEGRCWLLVGEMTPGTIGDDRLVSNGFTTPDIGVIAGGEYYGDSTRCEAERAEELGYRWVLSAEATPGTTIPFFAEIFIPSTDTGSLTQMVVGNPNRAGEFVTFDAITLPEVPVPTGLIVGPPVPGRPLDNNATFDYEERGDEWTGRIHALEATSLSRFNSREGNCYLVLGELTPTAIDEGIISDRFSTPNIGTITSGQFLDDSTGCDTEAAEARGYDWILNAEVTLGTKYLFFAHVFVPDTIPGEPTQIVVGNNTDTIAVFTI